MSSLMSLNTLHIRSLLPRDNTPSNFTCARPKSNDYGIPLSIGITFKSLMTYITAISFVFTAISALILGTKHLRHYTVPKEQRQIIRIVLMPLSFGIIAFLSVVFYEQSIYLKPIMQVYEALCVSALFFLFLEYVCPDANKRTAYFSAVENKDKKGNVIPGGSLLWFNYTWVAILQFPLMKLTLTIIEISTQVANVYCTNSLSPTYAHLWVMLIDIFIVGGAITALFRFYGRLKPEFAPEHRALGKLVAFKGMVIFQFFMDIIFGFLNGKTFKPSENTTYNDLYYGLPMMLTAIVAMAFSFSFHWAFSPSSYIKEERSIDGQGRMPIGRAMLDVANWMDIIKGIYVAFVKKSYDGVRDSNVPRGWLLGGTKRQRTVEQVVAVPAQVPDAYRGFSRYDGQLRRSNESAGVTRAELRTIV